MRTGHSPPRGYGVRAPHGSAIRSAMRQQCLRCCGGKTSATGGPVADAENGLRLLRLQRRGALAPADEANLPGEGLRRRRVGELGREVLAGAAQRADVLAADDVALERALE